MSTDIVIHECLFCKAYLVELRWWSDFNLCGFQILIQCSEMERLGIGLGHLKDIRVRCGVAAWTLMHYVLLLVLPTSLRM